MSAVISGSSCAAVFDSRLCTSIAVTIVLHAVFLCLPVSLKHIRQPEPPALYCLGIEKQSAPCVQAPAAQPPTESTIPPRPVPPVAVVAPRPVPRPVLKPKPVPEPARQQVNEPSFSTQATSAQGASAPVSAAVSAPEGSASAGPGAAQQPLDAAFGTVDGPRFLKRVAPQYPLAARRLGQGGRVVLRLTIDGSGILRDVQVIEASSDMFARAAEQAVRQSTFLPARKAGKEIVSRALLPFTFKLRS